MSSVAKSIEEPFKSEREMASTKILAGRIVGCVKWLSKEQVHSLKEQSIFTRLLTSHLLRESSQALICIDIHGIHQTPRICVKLRLGSFRAQQ